MNDADTPDSPGPPGRTVLLINARARRGARAVPIVADALRRRGLELDQVIRVRRPARLASVVEELVRRGVGRLIVGGGDGTLSTVAARLARGETLLGVIPLGTANDFARTLGIPTHVTEAAHVAAGSHVRAVDLAIANDAMFLNVASIGMSVMSMAFLTSRLKLYLGPSAYIFAGAKAFLRHTAFLARISTPAGVSERMVHQVVVGNGRFYGGGVLVAQGSTADDGTLDIYTLGARSRWQLLRTVVLLRFQVPLNRPGDVFLRSPTVHVETRPTGLPVNLDGEIRATTPVTFGMIRKALRVLTPEPE